MLSRSRGAGSDESFQFGGPLGRYGHTSRVVLGVAWTLSVGLHGGLLLLLVGVRPAETTREPPVPLRVVERSEVPAERPPEPLAREPEPIQEPRPVPPLETVPRRKQPPRPPSPRKDRPPPSVPSPASAPDTPSSPRAFGIRLENTVQAAPGTGIAIPVGETLAAPPPAPVRPRLGSPGGRGDGTGDTTPVASVQEMPKVVGESVAEYPDEARRLGIQGKVVLEVVVDEEGGVSRVRVLKGLHPLLDSAAVQAARGLRFSPARVGGRPVSVKIPYTYVFVLD